MKEHPQNDGNPGNAANLQSKAEGHMITQRKELRGALLFVLGCQVGKEPFPNSVEKAP